MLTPTAYTYSNALCWGLCREHVLASNETEGAHKWAHLTLYVLEFFPILGQLVSLIEVAVTRCFLTEPKPPSQPPLPRPPLPSRAAISTRFLHAAEKGSCLLVKLNALFHVTHAPLGEEQRRLFYVKVQEMRPKAIVSFIASGKPNILSSWKVPHYLIFDSTRNRGDVMTKIKDDSSAGPIILTYANDSFVTEPAEFAALYEGHEGYRTRMNAYQTILEEGET